MQKYIDQLNEAQREPVLQKDGPSDYYCWCRLRKNKGVDHSNRLFDESGRGCFQYFVAYFLPIKRHAK